MAYQKKVPSILQCCPNIVVVPECEYFIEETTKNLWFGDNRKKGLGIFSYSDFNLEIHKKYDPDFKYVIPIKVSGPYEFNLLAIWAMNDSKDPRKRYVGQVFTAIKYYKELLEKPTIILGDFNWNVIWDAKPSYPLYGNLNDVIKILINKEIKSAYHEFFGEEFGKETRPTFYMQHNEGKPYHIDYCFVSSDFIISNVEVGNFNDWIKRSDHMPLIITLDNR